MLWYDVFLELRCFVYCGVYVYVCMSMEVVCGLWMMMECCILLMWVISVCIGRVWWLICCCLFWLVFYMVGCIFGRVVCLLCVRIC